VWLYNARTNRRLLRSAKNVDNSRTTGSPQGPCESRATERSLNIPPFIVMDILERAHEIERSGRPIVHLEIGEPDFPTPDCIREAAVKAIRDGCTHYTHSLGSWS